MGNDNLGPNGGVLYALEELEHNFEWLEEGLKELGDDYVLFDCPGQVELYTHHNSLRNIFFKLQKMGYRVSAKTAMLWLHQPQVLTMTQLVVLHLSDSFCLIQPSLYISNLLLALRAMMQMDLPHINVLTKIDKVAEYEELPFNLDFYTEVQDLSHLLPSLEKESPALRSNKFKALNEAVANLVESFAMVQFEVLAVENKKSMMHLLRVIDRAGGYVFGGAEGANDTVWQVSMRNESSMLPVQDIQERWVDHKDLYDEAEAKEEEQAAKVREARAEANGQGGDAYDDFDDMPIPPLDSGINVTRNKK